MTELLSILGLWKNVEIASRLVRFLARVIGAVPSMTRHQEAFSIAQLRDGFFSEQTLYGDSVKLAGRLSQYCPVYFPLAYTPQLMGPVATKLHTATREMPSLSLSPRINPPLTSTHVRSSAGNTLAFLFEESAGQTPPLISLRHPDRSSDNPFPPMVRGLPVVVDTEDEAFLDDIVEVRARISRVDAHVAEAIAESRAPEVHAYYRDFYRRDRYPNAGFVLDARHSVGGRVRALHRFAPFFTSLGVELALAEWLSETVIEDLCRAAMSEMATGPISEYQPAHYTPGGHRIKQFSSEDASVHIAPSLGVVSIGVRVDVKGDVSGVVTDQLIPLLGTFKRRVQEYAPLNQPKVLYASDPRFADAAAYD